MDQILLIDDEDAILDSISRVLTHSGYHVKVAHDGEEGIKLFKGGDGFDCVITGISMPKVNGNEVAEFIRNSDKSDIPVVNGAVEADIFLAGDGFYVEKIPIKPIWDLKVPKKFSNGSLPMRRCGVQFRDLTRHQRSQLEYFIQNHTLNRPKSFRKREHLTSPQPFPSN
jgi:response regulator RpfG family c-di-GMP phosphodiesterase